MYQALYRKWRPKTFADVIGQSHITQTLQRQVAEGHLSHAYLFTGTRGTGKTTCAKILAKAVNCENPVNGDPCNECESCRGIESGGFMDVMELDAASNNGVDHVRALRDEAIYSPARVKKRVYIIDEVHMLSVPAFNALLKILEEPPEHLMFILATTELHKVPATILSRCQRFSFKRITAPDIAARLAYVAQQEGIDLAPDGAELLSRLADGALRDGLSLLDQCAAAGVRVDGEAVLDTLGLAGGVQTAQLFEFVLRRDAKAALLLLGRLYTGGKDVGAILGEMSTLARDLLIRTTAPEGGASLLSGGFDNASLDRLGKLCNAERLIAVCTMLQRAGGELLSSTNRRTDAELCLLRMCDESLSGDLSALVSRVARLEDALLHGAAAVGAAAEPMQAEASAAIKKASPCQSDEPTDAVERSSQDGAPAAEEERPPLPDDEDIPGAFAPSVPAEPRQSAAAPKAAAPTAAAVKVDVWAQLIDRYKAEMSADKRSFLGMCCGTVEGDTLVVRCKNDIALSRMKHPDCAAAFEKVTSEALGRTIHVRFEVGEVAPQRAISVDPMQELLELGSKFDNFIVK